LSQNYSGPTPDGDDDLIQGVPQNSSPARSQDDPPAISLVCQDRDRSVERQQADLLRRAFLGQLRETASAHMTTDPSRVGAVALRASGIWTECS